MNDRKYEYVITYYLKNGLKSYVRSNNYGALLWEAAEEYERNKQVIDHYEISRVTETIEILKTSKE